MTGFWMDYGRPFLWITIKIVAIVIVLLIADPLCVLSSGFWLSFVGVGWLMFCLQDSTARKHGWKNLIRSQGIASLGLLPLGIWFFGQSSLIGPLANLVAVPVICFFVLPVGVLAALVAAVLPAIGFPLLVLVGHVALLSHELHRAHPRALTADVDRLAHLDVRAAAVLDVEPSGPRSRLLFIQLGVAPRALRHVGHGPRSHATIAPGYAFRDRRGRLPSPGPPSAPPHAVAQPPQA